MLYSSKSLNYMQMRIKPVVLLVAALLLPAWPLAATDSAAGPDRLLCVASGASRLLEMGFRIDEVYGTFVTVRACAADERRLAGAGVQFFEMTGLDEVVLPGASFSPSPAAFASKGLDGLRLDGDGPFNIIVKLKGPVKPEWTARLEATGAQFMGGALSHCNFIVRADRAQVLGIAALAFVRWVGELRPEHKLPYPLADGAFKFDMVFFKQASGDFAEALSVVRSSGGEVVELDDGTAWWSSAVVRAPRAAAEMILGLPGLWALETSGTAMPRNDVARWVLQSGDAATTATPFWDAGLIGNGEVAGIADSGIDYDHLNFRDKMNDAGVPGPDHRKIIRYNTSVDDWDSGAPMGHGTHTAGSLAGDSLLSPMGYDTYDGLAFGAKLAEYDITTPDGTWDPPLIRGILGDAYEVGAHTHSDSWGDDRKEYTLRAQRVDQFQWDHPDFLSLWAAGNTGPSNGSVLEPATCKNAVAVGASANGNSTDLASFSAHGPTQEGLTAPLIVAPGRTIHSARSDNQQNTYNDGYTDMSGTSMATPFASASSILIEQYFLEGFYPDGARRSGPAFQPSGPLRKAILAASGTDLSGGAYVTGPIPDFSQGWGRIDLANALYLANYPKSNRVWVSDFYNDSHQNDGLATGEQRTQMITVNSSRPLRVMLAWNDWPGAGLVNDLNLEVVCPDGTVYRGNQFQNGSSVASGTADSVNTVEGVIIQRPSPGLYVVRVTAVNVPGGEEPGSGRQRYALVATGDLFDSSVGLVQIDRERTGVQAALGVTLLDSDLSGTGQVTVTAESTTETDPEPLRLTETAQRGLFAGTLNVAPGTPARDGTLQVRDADTVTVSYVDQHPPGLSYDTCVVDGAPPVIRSVELENITNNSAFLRFSTDEVSSMRVLYKDRSGERSATDWLTAFGHELELSGLSPRSDYTVDIEVADLFGNVRREDFSGNHVTFRTHDLTYRPRQGYAGWATALEGGNRFAEEGLSSGVLYGYPRMAGMRFDASDYPSGVIITAGQFRLMVRGTDAAYADSLWTVEMLDAPSAQLFDGSSRPNYTALRDAGYEDYLGAQFGPSALAQGRWQLFNLTEAQCRVLGRELPGGYASFRIKGPLSGPDSLLEWYSGRSPDTVFWAPQLVLDIAYAPRVAPLAPQSLAMDEDTVDSTSINCSRIFLDDEPLKYDAPVNFEGAGSNLTVTVAADGATTFRPRENWNGAETVPLRATDPFGLATTHELAVTVRPVNDPPRIVAVNGTAPRDGMQFLARQDEQFSISIEVADPDLQFEGERLWYVTNDTLVRFESASGPEISFRPSNDDVGTRRVRVSVRDPDYEDSVNLTFVIENANDPPVAYMELPSANGSYDNATPVHFSAWGSFDPDTRWGDVLNYTWESNGTDLIGYGEELNATLTPGRHTVTLVVRDLSGAFDTVSVEIGVKAVEIPPPPPPPGNGAPRMPWWREQFVPAGIAAIIVLALVAAFLAARRGASRPAEAAAGPAQAKAPKRRPPGAAGKSVTKKKAPAPAGNDDEPCGEAEDALDVDALQDEKV
jgi:hypothetical protein